VLTKPGWQAKVAPHTKLLIFCPAERSAEQAIVSAGKEAHGPHRGLSILLARPGNGRIVENPRFATLKAINHHDGRNIEDPRQIVDDFDID